MSSGSPPRLSSKAQEAADPAHHLSSTQDGSSVDDDMLVEKRFGLKNEFVR